MKPIAWIFALLPLVGVALFYLQSPPAAHNVASDGPSGAPKSQPQRPPLLRTKPKLAKSAELMRLEESIEQTTKEVKEAGAKIAEKITPELQQVMVDGDWRQREPHYLGLFASWDTDSATIEDTVRIIRDRDSKIMQLRTQFTGEGLSFYSDFKKKSEIVAKSAEKQLSERLGRKRFDELSQMESQLQAEAISRAKRFFKN